jgi:hypothetical protein
MFIQWIFTQLDQIQRFYRVIDAFEKEQYTNELNAIINKQKEERRTAMNGWQRVG